MRWRTTPQDPAYEVSEVGDVRLKATQRELMQTYSGGYFRVALHRRKFLVHRLVAAAFIGESDLDVLHENDVKTDNRVSNLRYGTNSQNQVDSVRNGTHHLARRTHCPQGHEYTEANTMIRKNGSRACRACRAVARRAHYERTGK